MCANIIPHAIVMYVLTLKRCYLHALVVPFEFLNRKRSGFEAML